MRTAMAVLATGCARGVTLDLVPIIGGSDMARAAARAELDAFDGWVGHGRVRLVSVEFDPDTPGGEYDDRRVRLTPNLPTDGWVRVFLRHELAHALDYQDSDLAFDFPALERWAERLPDDSPRDQLRQAFANACELGPFGSLLHSDGDCGVDATTAAVSAWLSTAVWKGYSPPDWVDPGPTEAVYRDGPDYWYFRVYPTERADRIGLELLLDSSEPEYPTVDLHTGELTDPVATVPIDTVPPVLDEGGLMVDWRGWPEGPGLGMVTAKIDPVGTLPLRMASYDGERWHPVTGCVAGLWGLVTAEDRVWYVEGDGHTISWGPVP